MTMVAIFRNRIPVLVNQVGMSISDLQRETKLSYPAVHALASEKSLEISQNTQIGTLQLVAEALNKAGLNVTVNDLYIVTENGNE